MRSWDVGGSGSIGVWDGRGLARAYHDDVVGPLLAAKWPELPHATGRLGSGSDVLGLDDATSRDHDWGLRLTLLVDETRQDEVDRYLAAELPETYAGLPTKVSVHRSGGP